MVSDETLLSYPDWKILFTVNNDTSDKHLGSIIIQNNKHIALFSRILINPQRNYTTNEKEILAVVEWIKLFRGILFVYKINLFSYHKNLVHATTLSEYQRVMRWWKILGEFGPNIQHISGVDNIVADTLSRFPSTSVDKYEPCIRKDQCRANELFVIGRVENNEYCFPLNILIVQR